MKYWNLVNVKDYNVVVYLWDLVWKYKFIYFVGF